MRLEPVIFCGIDKDALTVSLRLLEKLTAAATAMMATFMKRPCSRPSKPIILCNDWPWNRRNERMFKNTIDKLVKFVDNWLLKFWEITQCLPRNRPVNPRRLRPRRLLENANSQSCPRRHWVPKPTVRNPRRRTRSNSYKQLIAFPWKLFSIQNLTMKSNATATSDK